jgi:SAM-dependent methyltransferase
MLEQRSLAPGKTLVLGAGRGHDARLFARHRFAVTAVDFAPDAAREMLRLNDPDFPVEVVEGDFFTLPQEWTGQFDYVLDYTSFCAILPARRPEYADLVARMLRSGGQLIMLAFPIGTRTGGPPYALQPDAIVDLFAERALRLVHREQPADSVAGRAGYEELLLLEKD